MKKDTDALRKELEKEAPFLARLKEKPGGMTVPEGYFDQLQQEVLKRAATENQRPSRRVFQLWPRMAVAASFVAAIGLSIFLFQPDHPAANQESLAISAEEVDQYISQHIDDFDLDMLIQYASVSENEGGLFNDATLDDPQLQQYMEELLDDIDLETLEELL
ncbi:MAG: hypothetical protein IPJ40_11090 [Saprospirales bacterium]|nr:hypothetical protein [Saprospirales bacterium]